MDLATIAGLAGGFFLVILGMIFNNMNPLSIVDFPSLMITFGGGTMGVLISHPLEVSLKIMDPMKKAFFPQKFEVAEMILRIITFAENARRNGLLALEDELSAEKEEFLRKGIQLVVDGTDPELVRNILEVDIDNLEARHQTNIAWFEDMGILLPAFGMIGTLLGLIQMLGNLGGDSSGIGAGMAVALITTLYGSIGANLVFIPLGKKLLVRHKEELIMKSIMLEGTLSIQQGENPRVIKDKLASFLPPSKRDEVYKGDSD